ncbi:hypothetical protein HQ29_05985 [Porphyromonas canoris]|nr:hypothetical protein HQ29_05985 [Porphyromonas canoris]
MFSGFKTVYIFIILFAGKVKLFILSFRYFSMKLCAFFFNHYICVCKKPYFSTFLLFALMDIPIKGEFFLLTRYMFFTFDIYPDCYNIMVYFAFLSWIGVF